MNKCFFIGRTTKDIELRYNQNNLAIGKFNLAVDTGYGSNKKTNYFHMVSFGKTAETLEKYVPKGRKIAVECQATPYQYTDKDGNQVDTVHFIVLSFEFAESKSDNKEYHEQQKTFEQGLKDLPDSSELPFAKPY